MNEKIYIAKDNYVNSTVRKVSLVTKLIKNTKASVALNRLRFCNCKISDTLFKCLSRTIADAENNFNANIDRLYVHEILMGKAMTLKRWRPRAKGRGCRILKQKSKIQIKLKEQED